MVTGDLGTNTQALGRPCSAQRRILWSMLWDTGCLGPWGNSSHSCSGEEVRDEQSAALFCFCLKRRFQRVEPLVYQQPKEDDRGQPHCLNLKETLQEA